MSRKSGGSRDTIDVTTGQAVRKTVVYGAGGGASVESFPVESSSAPSSGLPSSHPGGHPAKVNGAQTGELPE